ncbi:MAG TPA: nucleotidyltransferase family protein [Candidatus Binataceae bacterium]|nr:nucleotidyltransferase family protein [Candidatus Binataceae bacterium]
MNSIASALKSGPAPSREAELLICCATSVATPERTARLRAIADAGVDWRLATHMASVQAVMPLVHRYLTAELPDALSADAAGALRRAYHGNSLRNLHLARELGRLTALLERGGVEPLALKGPALALAAYGALALRQFTDLDLLVRESEVGRAAEILIGEDYAPAPGYGLADLGRPGAYEIALARAGALTEVDLHWRLVPPYFPLALDGEDLWRRAVRIEIEGVAVRTLAPADHLLYLCAHGAKHGWQALGGICDLAELIRASSRASPIDWDDLCARAKRAGADRALGLGVLLAHELLDAAVPAGVLEVARREPAVMRAARGFIRYASNPGDRGPGFYQRWSVPLRVIAKPGARLRYLAARALLPSADDREFLRLPPALYPLYYLLRPVRVAFKEGPAAWRRLVVRPAPPPLDDSSR